MHNPIQKMSLLIYEGLASFRSKRSWLPLFYFWLLNFLGLIFLTRFMELPGSDLTAGWLESLYGAEFFEYPRLYLLLPDMQRKLYLLLALTLGAVFRGASLLYLVEHHTRGQVKRPRPWRRSLRLWPGHFLINLIVFSLFILPILAKQWIVPALGGATGRFLYVASFGVGFTFMIFLLYAPLLYLSFRSGVWEAMSASIRFAREHIWVTIGLVLIPFFFGLPLQFVPAMRRAIAANFKPELIFWLLTLTSLLTVMLLFLQLAMLVRFYADEVLRRPFEGEWDDKPSYIK